MARFTFYLLQCFTFYLLQYEQISVKIAVIKFKSKYINVILVSSVSKDTCVCVVKF